MQPNELVSFIQNKARATLALNFFRQEKGTYNERKNLAHQEMNALSSAMNNPKADHSEEFAKFNPESAALLKASLDHIKGTYFKKPPFPPFPKDGLKVGLKENDIKQIEKQANVILDKRTVTFTNGDKDKYVLRFSRDLSASEKRKLKSELLNWRKTSQSLTEAFLKANVFADQVFKIEGKERKEVDSNNVMGRSMIKGEARDFIYTQMGLKSDTLGILERALAYESKDDKFDSIKYFDRTIKDQNQRALAVLASETITTKSQLKRGVYSAGPNEAAEIKQNMDERKRQLDAYKQPLSPRTWNIASINTPEGSFYFRIPKSLMNEEAFNDAVRNKTTPEEIALVFGLVHVKDMMIQKYEGGSFRQLTAEERKYFDSLNLSGLRMATLTGSRKERKVA